MDGNDNNEILIEDFEDDYGYPGSPEVLNNHELSSPKFGKSSQECLHETYSSDKFSQPTPTNWTQPTPDSTLFKERKICTPQSGNSEYNSTSNPDKLLRNVFNGNSLDIDNEQKGPGDPNKLNDHVKSFCMSSIGRNSKIAQEKITINESYSSTKPEESSSYGKLKRGFELTESQPTTSKRFKEFEVLEPLEILDKKIVRKKPPLWSLPMPTGLKQVKEREQWIAARNAELYRRRKADELTKAIKEKKNLKEDNINLNEENNNLREENNNQKKVIDNLNEENRKLEEEKKLRKVEANEIGNCEIEKFDKMAKILYEDTGIKKDLHNYRLQNETLQKDKESLLKDKEIFQKDKESLQKDKESLQKDKESLQKDKESLQKDKESLQKDKESLQKDKESLQKDKESLQKDKESLQKDKESMNLVDFNEMVEMLSEDNPPE